MMSAHLDSDGSDDSDDVPLVAYEPYAGGVVRSNPSFDLNANLDSDIDEHDDTESSTDTAPLVAHESNDGGAVTSNPLFVMNADLVVYE